VCVVLAITLSVGVACTNTRNSPSESANAARSQRARWEAAKITNYTWRNRLDTSWGGDLSTMTVVGDSPVKFLDNGEEASIEKDEEGGIIPLTIGDLFDVLDKGYTEGNAVTVTYDPTYGYPSHIHISPPNTPYVTVSDSEYDVSVLSFEPQQ
jgi:hypothetical protein